LVALIGLCAALSLVLVSIAHFPQMWPMLGLVPLAAYGAWRSAKVTPRILRWDGQVWHLHELVRQLPLVQGALPRTMAFNPDLDSAAPVRLAAVFDFGFCLLLRARRTSKAWAAPVYLPLTRSTQGVYWPQLRAVLYSARRDPG
jgi:hypothetical protein